MDRRLPLLENRCRMSKKPKNAGAHLRADVREAIERLWPEGVLELNCDPDESYFHTVHPRLARAFQRIPNTQPPREHEANPEPVWYDSDRWEDPPDDIPPSRSYHRFFISPRGEDFEFEIEPEDEPEFSGDDAGEDDFFLEPASGSRRIGWLVAISLLAPFAVIELADVSAYDDGGWSEPEIESCCQTLEGETTSLESIFREHHGAEAYQTLVGLRRKLSAILEKWGIAVLPAEEWRKPVPSLQAGEACMTVVKNKVRVLDAFFFAEI